MNIKHVRPQLDTSDLQGTIRFYVDVLGFKLEATWPEDNTPSWAMLSAGTATIMFVQNVELAQAACTGCFYFDPADTQGLWKKIQGRVEIVSPLQRKSYGMEEFTIRDRNGYLLIFGRSVT